MTGDSREAKMVLDSADVVGESVVWDERNSCLLWVDIVGRRIHRLDVTAMAHEVWPTPEFVTSIGLREDAGAIVGLTRRIALWEFGEEFATLAVPEPDLQDNRLNEGRVAPDGSFWIGTMANNLTPAGEPKDQGPRAGRYYRVAADGGVVCLSSDLYGITNSMIWLEPDSFVTADTTQNRLYHYTVSRDGRTLMNRKPFAAPFDRGLPDGSCMDREGGIWTCRVAGGACLTRSLPDGAIERVVDLPCTWPTSCTFGGEDLDVLYITSARFTMTDDHLSDHPQEGGLFSFRPGVSGVPENRFRLAPGRDKAGMRL